MNGMDVDADSGVGVVLDEYVPPEKDASANEMSSNMNTIGTREEVVKTFEAFRVELDGHHDRRERLIKVILTLVCLERIPECC